MAGSIMIDDDASGALASLVRAHPANAVWAVTSSLPLAIYDGPSLLGPETGMLVAPGARIVVAEASSLPLVVEGVSVGTFLWLANGAGWVVDSLPSGRVVVEREGRPPPLSRAVGFVALGRKDVTFVDNGRLSLDDGDHIVQIKMACPDPCEVYLATSERPLRIYDAPGLGSQAKGITVAPRARIVICEER